MSTVPLLATARLVRLPARVPEAVEYRKNGLSLHNRWPQNVQRCKLAINSAACHPANQAVTALRCSGKADG